MFEGVLTALVTPFRDDEIDEAALRSLVDRRVSIELRGGVLEISWPADDAHVEMTGPAAQVFTGVIRV